MGLRALLLQFKNNTVCVAGSPDHEKAASTGPGQSSTTKKSRKEGETRDAKREDCHVQSRCKLQDLCLCVTERCSSTISLIIGVFFIRVCEVKGQRSSTQTHTHLEVQVKAPRSLFTAKSACHLFREDDLSFWLYLWMRGERECSFTKSSGNLYWGNMVSKKPSRKT